MLKSFRTKAVKTPKFVYTSSLTAYTWKLPAFIHICDKQTIKQTNNRLAKDSSEFMKYIAISQTPTLDDQSVGIWNKSYSARTETKKLLWNGDNRHGIDAIENRKHKYNCKNVGQVIRGTFSSNLLRNVVVLQVERVVARITTACSTCHATNFSVASWKTLLQQVKLGSTLRNILLQLATLKFVAWQVEHASSNTGNNAFQLAMQQCCATSWTKMLPVLLGLKKFVL